MKYLFVGDVHNHMYMFDDVERLDKHYNFDKIVFVGDYVDDWMTDNHHSLKTLDKVISLKRANPDKYIFTLGNHELSYLGYKCAGHKYELEDVVELKLKENIDCFDIYAEVLCGENTFICSHAGFSNDFINKLLDGIDGWKDVLAGDILKKLYLLSLCSYTRGGASPFGSCLWTDRKEHLYYNRYEKPLLSHQIIGHTPVEKIMFNDSFIFIDTHSTYRDGTPFGIKSYLVWDDNKFVEEI